MKNSQKITFSTYLTLVRLIGAPVLVPFFIVNYASPNHFITNLLIAFLFLFFGFTDFLDGFLARKYAQETQLGASLDHLADKYLMFSACLALVAIHKMGYFIAIGLIGREFFVMGLREIALENSMVIRVSSWGKLKTFIHIVLIAWIIMNPAQIEHSFFWNGVEAMLLIMSLIISWASALQYFIQFYAQLKNR